MKKTLALRDKQKTRLLFSPNEGQFFLFQILVILFGSFPLFLQYFIYFIVIIHIFTGGGVDPV